MRLTVIRGNIKVGTLDMAANEPFYGFTYDSHYLSSNAAMRLSLSLPLSDARFSGIQAQPFFEGLLPEGDARDAISRRLGISRSNSVSLLSALGRDCAGDISVIQEEQNGESPSAFDSEGGTQAYLPLERGISWIAEHPYDEVERLQVETRLSLAGKQSKVALYHQQGASIEEGWYIPSPGFPSTHIIKPGLLELQYPYITLNEFLCLRAAKSCGIQTVDADILFPKNPVLITKRYDRLFSDVTVGGLYSVNRIHQEDCCQACGIISDMKHEHDGGPGFKSVRDLLVRHTKLPIGDITSLVKWGLFNYLIGNCNAHAKNISVIHNVDGTISLAPAYDLVCTTIYDGQFGSKLNRNPGMQIGLQESIDNIGLDDFAAFSKDVHMRKNQVGVLRKELISALPLAFESACSAAESRGFTSAREVARRIISDCRMRAARSFA